MTTEFTWAIANLERNTSDGKVIVAHYTVSAKNDTYSAGAYGSLGFDGEIETPFSELTEQQIVGWVTDSLGENQLDEQAAPTKAAGLPWVNG
jgi:hypothetical protein